jgi:hypothetical protein
MVLRRHLFLHLHPYLTSSSLVVAQELLVVVLAGIVPIIHLRHPFLLPKVLVGVLLQNLLLPQPLELLTQ